MNLRDDHELHMKHLVYINELLPKIAARFIAAKTEEERLVVAQDYKDAWEGGAPRPDKFLGRGIDFTALMLRCRSCRAQFPVIETTLDQLNTWSSSRHEKLVAADRAAQFPGKGRNRD